MDDKVKQYLAQKYGMDSSMAEAQQLAQQKADLYNTGSVASSFANALTGNPNASNSWYQDQIKQTQQPILDLQNQDAQQMRQLDMGSQVQKMQATDDMNDPASAKSVAMRQAILSQFPKLAQQYGADFDKIAAADKDFIMEPLKLREIQKSREEQARLLAGQRQDSNMFRQQELMMKIAANKEEQAAKNELKKAEAIKKNSPEERQKSLPAGDKARLDNARMALQALDEMGQALDAGNNTFSLVGDNAYTAAERRATEAYGRMQSGGAISKEEEARFSKTLPGATDSKDMQRKKLLTQKNEMLSRLKTLGFSPEDLGVQTKDFNYGKSKQVVRKQYSKSQNKTKLIYNDGTEEIVDGQR